MNVLILTGRFGMGHYSAATAIKEELECKGPMNNVTVVDIIEFLMPCLGKFIYSGFNMLVSRWSSLYNTLNKVAGSYSAAPFKNTFIRKLDKLISEYTPDLIISTLPMSSQYVSLYKEVKNPKIPLYTYVTDISTNDEWIAKNTTLYFVGTKGIKESLMSKGIKENQIRVSGIPVKQKFKKNEVSYKKTQQKEVLIMGGGLGLIPFSDALFERLNNEQSIKTTVITGKNKELYTALKEKYPSLNIVGYTDQIYEHMRRAELIVSKAGGITLFEAVYSETPLYVINPFLIQEINNAKYIQTEGLGKVIWKEDRYIAQDLIHLLNNKKELEKMRLNMKNLKEDIKNISVLEEIQNLEKGA